MKAITCLDPIDHVNETSITTVEPKSVNKETEHNSLGLSPDAEGFEHTYAAAKKLVHDFDISIEDIATLSEKFWTFYLDGACVVNTAATIVVSIHWNLCMGTIAPHAEKQPHLLPLLRQLAEFQLCGEFMLTEVGHGLDARNIETTATLSPDGTFFDLHTPSAAGAKSMPPATPLGGVPKVAVVFAQIVVDGKRQGVRAFVVHLTDGRSMCEGVTTILLPQRPGSRPIDHAVTTFTHVKVDRNCLLGDIERVESERQSFFEQIHRVSVGGLALSLCNVPALKACAYLAATFSQQRMVISPSTRAPVPIISFPTQYGPIISTVAQAAVMETMGHFGIGAFMMPKVPEPLRHAIVCVFKATVTHATQRHLIELTDRCGWRGLFAFNRISEIQLVLKGNSIAEGDVLVLCIRLASELLQDKYQIPPPENPTSLLAQHEQGLFDDLKQFVTRDEAGNTNHRSDHFAQNITPRARDLIQAIGHRFAYESALTSGVVRKELLDVWEADCMLQDAAWYVENTDTTNQGIHAKYQSAIESVRPHLNTIIGEWDMEKYFGSTPLISKEHWDGFMEDLPSFGEEGASGEMYA